MDNDVIILVIILGVIGAVVAGLMIRFVLICINRIKIATTGLQVFSALVLLGLGFVLFPITLMIQAFEVAIGDSLKLHRNKRTN